MSWQSRLGTAQIGGAILFCCCVEAEESGEEEEEEEREAEEEGEGRGGDTAKQKQIFIQELLLASLSLATSLDEQDGGSGCESWESRFLHNSSSSLSAPLGALLLSQWKICGTVHVKEIGRAFGCGKSIDQ